MNAHVEPVREPETEADLRRRVAKLERINAALMAYVERSTDQQGGAYALFQTAITLEGRVRSRTEALTGLMRDLENSNAALVAAKEEAETANRSKTRFLAAASHDLLQPLNAARLSLSALADLPLAPEAGAIAGQVERGLQTIEDLIKTLLDISKLDAGIVRPEVRALALPDLLAELAESFRPFAERKGLRLAVRCPDVTVASDGVLLRRILQNLVSNAVRYTASGGVLLVARPRGGAIRIDVIDTGCGIGAEERTLVFDEFYRGGGKGSGPEGPGEPGLGLGLSIVRRMAAALDHPLDLASRPGHGTRVSLTLPLSEAPVEPRPAPAPVATRLSGAHVLIVENDASTAEAMRRLLQNWDAEVSAFRDLGEVRAALAAGLREPDILVLDYHLDDGACGLDVATYLRAVCPAPLPVILTTADYAPEIEARTDLLGIELMRKPVKPAQLRSLLTYMLA
ncbi:hybrid sensor histidine kinase/response regulator [Methylobacterium gregans]|uniref:histidine kinase n=1 Tax=Methylobacterium gregans TaxID=374424 RepID=A0AA37HJP2_9HYPH|nr:hybrid sensor histidine kinase/response regulator [Methylobacterium gregans]MDQ0519696.1 signal transduction histidine kinase [Methylobacterium gregans]GJD76855.1 Autoinducer 2 sensor kinase/phosphatase LuxQ [Methylobacterium gregans]GLS56183.1 hybrid sensor histidine kinase/response regulator [Methylobacterium gregans]